MQFRKATQEDYIYFREHSRNADFYKEMPSAQDYDYVLELNHKPIVIGGLSLITRTTAWGWFDFSDDIGNNIIIAYRTIKEWLQISTKELGIKRVMAWVEVGFEEGERTVMHLGFHKESRMHNFINDKPADMWVKYFGDSK